MLSTILPLIYQYEARALNNSTVTTEPTQSIIAGAEKAKKRGDYDSAIRIYKGGIARFGNNAALWTGLAMTHSYFGNVEAALVPADKAISIDPKNPLAWYIRGSVLNHMNQHTSALAALKRASGLVETSSIPIKQKQLLTEKILISIGYAFCNLGNLDNAIIYTENALKINPKSNTARLNIGSYYLFKSPDFSKFWYKKAVAMHKTVNALGCLKEQAEYDYYSYHLLELGNALRTKVSNEAEASSKKGPDCDPMRVFKFIKGAILKYPKNMIPGMVNAYWQNNIKYVPDPVDGMIKEWNYKDPRLLSVDQWGDCDDMISFANDIFDDARITYINITYKFNVSGKHDICAFKNAKGGWDYIDSDGLFNTNSSSLTELMGNIRLVPIEKTAHTFIIKDHNAIKTGSISFK